MVSEVTSTSNATMTRCQSLAYLEPVHSVRLDEIRDRLKCLRRQEAMHYLCDDYIHRRQQDSNKKDQPKQELHSCSIAEQCARVVSDLAFSPPSGEVLQNSYPSAVCVKDLADAQAKASFIVDGRSPASASVVGFWRQQMLDWSNLVTDSFGIDREVVAVSFNILDRYVAKEIQSNIPITREDFQLFSMTCLFIAVKCLETYPKKITADALVDMSRGFYASEDILTTEQEILKALKFFLNPTTAIGFCRIYWDLFPLPVSLAFKNQCQSMAEMALGDTFFLTRKSSVIGLAAFLHASRSEGYEDSVIQNFLADIRDTLCFEESDEVDTVYRRLEYLSQK